MAEKKKKSFSVGGLGGTGTTGALGDWDVLGKGLDKGNPWLDPTADEKSAEADAFAAEAKAYWDDLEAPNLGPVDYEEYSWLNDLDAGTPVNYQGIDPALATATTIDRSAFEDVNVDPRLVDQQMASLDALNDIVDSGGLTDADRAVLSRISSRTAAEDKGRREGILQNMQQRGMGGSGMELLAQLQSSQAATDRAAQEGLDVAGLAQQRALDAIMSGGDLAGNIRAQDFGEQAERARARDIINSFNAGTLNENSRFNAGTVNDAAKFNAGNTLDTAKFNKGVELDVAKTNLEGRQGTADKNTAVQNQQTDVNKVKLPQANFDNSVIATQGKAGAAMDQSNLKAEQAKNAAAEAGQKKGAIIKGAGALMASDERGKKDVKKVSKAELDELLSSIGGGKKFKYRDTSKPGTGEGVRIGFMAQDIKDTALGKDIVKDTEDGLMIDTNNLLGVILASLSKGK